MVSFGGKGVSNADFKKCRISRSTLFSYIDNEDNSDSSSTPISYSGDTEDESDCSCILISRDTEDESDIWIGRVKKESSNEGNESGGRQGNKKHYRKII